MLANIPSAIRNYGLAVLSVGFALGISLFLFSYKIESVEFPIFLIAIAVTAWYAGVKPAIVSLVLSGLAFNYYFTEPYYSLYITWTDVPYYLVFILFAIIMLTTVELLRRRSERLRGIRS